MTFRRTTCPHCRAKLEPGQRIHPACIDGYAEAQESKAKRTAQKQARAAAKVERAEIKRRKEAVKTRGQWQAEAQASFNAFIRARDMGKGCVSCRALLVLDALGGGYDCGHYRSVGSAPHLRFAEDNAHGQCKKCNRYLSGNVVDYRTRLLHRIGIARLDALEADQALRHYSIDALKAIKANYAAKARELKKAQS